MTDDDDDAVDEAIERFEEMVHSVREKLRPLHPGATPQELMDLTREAVVADPALRAQMEADLNILADAGLATRLSLH